jgi:hypothetical protein
MWHRFDFFTAFFGLIFSVVPAVVCSAGISLFFLHALRMHATRSSRTQKPYAQAFSLAVVRVGAVALLAVISDIFW